MAIRYDLEFYKNLSIKNGGKCLSDNYINGKTKLKFRCKCGHEWEAQPRKVKEGSWCPTCAFERIRKYKCDDEIFSRETEETFYLAGFLAADGWVSRKTGAYSIGVSLSTKDLEHIELIKKILKTDAPIKIREKTSTLPNKKINTSEMATLIVSSKQIFNDLQKFNVIENKTYKMDISEWLMSHNLVRHFLRGYIDGDGCFAFAKNKNQSKHITFCLPATVEFLDKFTEIMYNNGIILEKREKLIPKKGKKYLKFSQIQYSGNNVISKMYDYLYKDATIFLNRKKYIAEQSKSLKVYGNKPRKPDFDALNISKEELLELAERFKRQKDIAEHLRITSAYISYLKKKHNISEEFNKILKEKAKSPNSSFHSLQK